MNLKSGLFEKDCDCVELLLLCAILFVDLCQGLAVAAAVSFSVVVGSLS